AGLVYGVSAFPVALGALTAGAFMGFVLSRHLFQARFRQAMERRPNWQRIVHAVDSQGWILVVMLRLASPLPSSASTYLLGLTTIRVWPYVGATCCGLAPQTFLFILMGAAGPAALDGGPLAAIKLAFVLTGLATSAIVIWLVGRRVRAALSAEVKL